MGLALLGLDLSLSRRAIKASPTPSSAIVVGSETASAESVSACTGATCIKSPISIVVAVSIVASK